MKKIIVLIFATTALTLSPLAFAYAQATISISPGLPGMQNVSTAGPCGWILSFYTFAMIIAGILAFGAIVYGGVKYATSVGNSSKQGEGRGWIWSALLGLFLLGAAWLILHTVNPSLTQCSLSSLSPVPAYSGGGTGGTTTPLPPAKTSPPISTSGNCGSGQCKVLPSCTPAQGNPTTGAGTINCGGAPGMVNTLNCIQQKDPNFTVSEGYPPAVAHTSAGHNNGCSVDVHVSGGCSGVTAVQAAAQACGATSLNEYSGCPGSKIYGTTTGNNVHINAVAGSGGC